MNASLRTHSRFFSLGLLLGLLSLSVLAAPTVSLTAPANAVSYLAPASVTVSASASPSSGTTITQIDFYQGSTLIGSDTTSPYSIIWSPGPGNYNLTAKATDSAGGVTTSAARTLAVNAANSAPTVSLTNPVANAIYTLPATVMLTASANGVEINTPITQVEFYQGATLIGKVSAAPYSILWSPTAAGSYGLTAKATDSAGGEKTSAVRNVSIRAANASQVYYLHTDHLDTPRLVTNESNAVVWRSQPLGEPFGNSAPEEDPDGNGVPFSMNLRFPGQYFDKETNTNYNYYRDYDPATGRYLQSDPIGLAGGINTYGYVGGSPLSFVDPNGLAASIQGLCQFCHLQPPPVIGSTIPRPKDMTPKEEGYYDRYCRNSDDPCKELKAATNAAIAQARIKMTNMLNDDPIRGLYRNAYSEPNPAVTGTNTTWMGHVDDLDGRRASIWSMIALGRKMGCDMSAETAAAITLYTPGAPR